MRQRASGSSPAGLRFEDVPCPGCASSAAREAFYARAYASNQAGLRFRYCACQDCGALYLSPRPHRDEMSRFYPGTYHLPRSPAERIARGLADLSVVLQMGLRQPGHVVDWGCGAGELVEVLRMLGQTAHGYDPLGPGGGSASGVILNEMDEAMALLPRVTTITLLDTLEHLYDPADLLAAWSRCTPAEIYVFSPRGDSLEVRRFRGHAYVVQAPTHLFLPTRQSLQALAARTGWAVSSCPQPHTSFWELDWQLLLRGRAFPAQGPEGLPERLIRLLVRATCRMSRRREAVGSAHLAAILRRPTPPPAP